MAGNSKRRGAVRKPGSKKGPQVGSGGQRRRGLEGRGPTPKATERTGHPAAARKAAAERSKRPARKPAERQGGGGLELVTGRNAVLEAVRAGVPIEQVFLAVRVDADERIGEVMRTATARNVTVHEATKGELDRLAEGGNHQGIAIQVPPYQYADPADLLDRVTGRPPLIVALDGVTDPHNLGAVLRSAGAFGVDGVVVPERRAAGVTATVWKVSAGAAARVPVARATNLVRALQDYKRAGCFVVGLEGHAPTTVADLELATEPLVVVVGSEGKGLSRLVRETCDATAGIEIASRVESLNAAVATGISLYEIARIRATR